jgi:hypothetical protein
MLAPLIVYKTKPFKLTEKDTQMSDDTIEHEDDVKDVIDAEIEQVRLTDFGVTGFVTLVAGTVTVADIAVTANTTIAIASKTPAGTVGAPYVFSKTAGTGYTIKSTSSTDTSVLKVTVDYNG